MVFDRRRFHLALAALALATHPVARAQTDAYPSRPVRILVPFPAGSGTDTGARILAQELTRTTGQSFTVENLPGASGFLAAQAAAKAAPDGNTLFVTTNTTHAANAALFKKLPYDPINDFIPISTIAIASLVLVVAPNSPYRSVADFLNAAKNRERELSFGSGSSSTRIAAEMVKKRTNARMLHVPYKGTPQALTDLMGGQIDFMTCDINPATPLVQGGKLRALAVTSAQRDPMFPEVPTLAESGLPGYELTSWAGVFVPAKTPAAVVARLHRLVVDAVASEAMRAQSARTGSISTSSATTADFAAFVKSETAKWQRIVTDAGIEPE